MPMKTLAMAFVEELKDLYSAEKQLTRALPKMAKAASHEKLSTAFEAHLKETEQHVERLEKVFEAIGRAASSKTCEAMKGLVEEGQELIKEEGAADVKDAMLIGAAQKVEHYEIASYGTLCTWAELLGYNDALKLLKQTLSEEKQTDEKLTGLATQTVNRDALKAA